MSERTGDGVARRLEWLSWGAFCISPFFDDMPPQWRPRRASAGTQGRVNSRETAIKYLAESTRSEAFKPGFPSFSFAPWGIRSISRASPFTPISFTTSVLLPWSPVFHTHASIQPHLYLLWTSEICCNP